MHTWSQYIQSELRNGPLKIKCLALLHIFWPFYLKNSHRKTISESVSNLSCLLWVALGKEWKINEIWICAINILKDMFHVCVLKINVMFTSVLVLSLATSWQLCFFLYRECFYGEEWGFFQCSEWRCVPSWSHWETAHV